MGTILGNGCQLSAYAANHDYEIRVMGVPKTIDNDVMGTDHTPGFGSAAKYIAASVRGNYPRLRGLHREGCNDR